MLLQLKIKNFLSFKEEAVFSLLKWIGSELKENLYDGNDIILPASMRKNFGILKSTFLYGSNWTWKTNLFKSLDFIKWMVVNSWNTTPNLPVLNDNTGLPFLLSNETSDSQSDFEILFEIQNTVYKYFFSVTPSFVKEERLFKYIKWEVKVTEKKLFERSVNKRIAIYDFDDKGTADRVLPNSLALSKFAHENSEEARKIIGFFQEIHIFDQISDIDYREMFKKYWDEFKDFTLQIMKNADFWIVDLPYSIERVEMPAELVEFAKINIPNFNPNEGASQVNISAKHNVYDKNHNIINTIDFAFKNESKGTDKILKLAGSLFDVIKNWKILFFDEIDIHLHHDLVQKLIRSLHKVKSDHKFQFVFTTHDPGLLDIETLRRDQVWFVKKDQYWASTLKRLIEYKESRKDIAIETQYRKDTYKIFNNVEESLVPNIK